LDFDDADDEIEKAIGEIMENKMENTRRKHTRGRMTTLQVMKDSGEITTHNQRSYHDFIENGIPKDLHNHVIVIGLPSELSDFILPLRLSDMEMPIPIVILSMTRPDENDFEAIADFPAVYYHHGSPLNSRDTKRCGILRARSVVILADPLNHRHMGTELADPNMQDADAIVTLRSITELCTSEKVSPFLIVELVRVTNMKLVTWLRSQQHNENLKKNMKLFGDMDETPKEFFTGGGDQGRNISEELEKSQDYIYYPVYCAGRVYLPKMLDSLVSESYKKFKIIDTVNLLVNGDSRGDTSKHLFQVKIPTKEQGFTGKTYGELFKYLLFQKKLVCVALFRSGQRVRSPLPYLYTNPTTDSLLDRGDMVFVIGCPKKHQRLTSHVSTKNIKSLL
jgi:hypothetical protein